MVLLFCSGAVLAQGQRPVSFAPDAARTAARLSVHERDERGFIKSAAGSARVVLEASKLALARSDHAGARALAAKLIDHHNGSNLELQYLSQRRGMAIPMFDNEQRKVLGRLGRLAGRKFDREYLEQVGLRVHREGIRQYEKAGANAVDPPLKAWIERQLPALRHHLVLAERAVGPPPKAALPVRRTGPAPAA